MPFIKWEPFKDIEKIFEDDLFNVSSKMGGDLATDIYEEGNNIIAQINVPGIDPKNVELSIEDDVLRISGQREEEKEEKGKKFYSKEVRRGSFERSIKLPARVQDDKTDAEYKGGVLIVTMPKKEVASSGKIDIKIRE